MSGNRTGLVTIDAISNAVRNVAELLEPLYALMGERVRSSRVIHTDDTPVAGAKALAAAITFSSAVSPVASDRNCDRGQNQPVHILSSWVRVAFLRVPKQRSPAHPACCNSLSDLSVEATRRLCFLCRLSVRINSFVWLSD